MSHTVKPLHAQAVIAEASDRLNDVGVTVGDAVLVEELVQLGERLAELIAAADEAAKQLAAKGDQAHAAALRDRIESLGGRC